ncbi:hypothetical protein [Mycobacterium sp. 1081908.1]|uniref:hypothetical protein n=1 Tax=Mycobacterium sp. 1081908.1 TaxID=1834066 RepID=UPI0007FF42F7|nr:hypothetical protein [Mycobacterium sp. 1081908.1]OBK44335.1 hypothetical protein A5655_14675 [Mycobacterium sp. 1081908.1]
MDQQDPQQRIAELELQLAQQKRIADLERQLADARAAAGQPVERPAEVSAAQLAAIDEHARRLAQALQADRGQPFGGPGAAPLREALQRAVVDAGLSQQQYRDALDRAGLRAGGTVKVGGQVVFQRCDPSDPVFLAPRPRGGFSAPPRRSGPGHVGVIVGLLGGAVGLCVGIAAAVTALIPSSALWMSPIVCRGGYAMAYNTSHYSYKPGQSGTTVSFQCVGDGDFYDVNDLAVFALQSLLAALLVFVALAVGGLLWRRSHKPA